MTKRLSLTAVPKKSQNTGKKALTKSTLQNANSTIHSKQPQSGFYICLLHVNQLQRT